MGAFGAARSPLLRGVKIILIVNVVLYLAELILAYAVGFNDERISQVLHPLALSADDVISGYVWQFFTYMWVHDWNEITHIIFNTLVLFWFGPMLEERWGTRTFTFRYLFCGLGGGLAIFVVGLVYNAIATQPMAPTLGASGAIAGLIMAYCIVHWHSTLGIFSLRFKGRTLFLVFIGIDLLRLVAGGNVAVQAHWGGMATMAVIMNRNQLSPGVLRLRLKRWRLKRRLRLKPGGKSNGDSRYMH